MSTLIQYPDKRIKLLVKGSDNVISSRLADTEQNKKILEATEKHLTSYAQEGLRTLMLAEKEIS